MKLKLVLILSVFIFMGTSMPQKNWTWYIYSTNLNTSSQYIDITFGLKANSVSDQGNLGNNTISGTMSTALYGFGSGHDPILQDHISNYDVTLTQPSGSNTWQVNCFTNASTGSGALVTTSGISVSTIRFNIQNSNGSSNITMDNLDQTYEVDGTTKVSVSYDASDGDVALPVELSTFSATVNSNNVNLRWETATEVNNNGFEIQRATGGQKSEVGSWEEIGYVQGHGNSSSPKEYSYTDKNITGGTKFIYRLKQIDNDGGYKYSKEIEVEVIPSTYELSQNYPNPFNPTTEIKYNLPEATRVTLKVYNIIGQQVASLVNGMIEAGYHRVMFDGRDLPSGTYIYRLQTPNYIQTKKMILLK